MSERPPPDEIFVAALDKAIEFHRANQNDPHNVSVAVMCALIEVRDAYRVAYAQASAARENA